jgi:hypothetical protein
MPSTLSLKALVRMGEKHDNGQFKSQRTFLDLIVNGVSLWERLGKPHDMVSVLCADYAETETSKALDRLLLTEGDVPNARTPLFICAECGDFGCGAITVSVKRTNDKVVWSDFGYENNYESGVRHDDYTEVGPFEFEFPQYQSCLLNAVATLKSQ